MPAKEPHVVLGVDPGAGAEEIKAAWRRLARQHHPDLTGDDPEASRRATRRMAEINSAYAALTRLDRAARGSAARNGRGAAADPDRAGEAPPRRRESRVPKPKPTRPVTGRLDTSETFRPRNQTTSTGRTTLRGHPPVRADRVRPDLRASTPSGPTRRERAANQAPPRRVPLDEATAVELAFGKFHGHTLGEVAAFEPSYIDWLASTVTRDPDLAAAARSIRDELDRRGIVRPSRPQRPGWRSNPFV